MRRLALYLAVAAALVGSAFGGHIIWGDVAPSAADGDTIVWGS